MLLSAALLACAVGVAPETMNAIVGVESGGRVLALHVNHLTGPQPSQAGTVEDAVATAQRFTRLGYTVDMGLTQLNSHNLARLGYDWKDAFDPCKNLAAGAKILSGFYGQAVGVYGEGQRALMSALSGYNTGSLWKGFNNGYVARYYINAPLATKIETAKIEIVKKPMKQFTSVVYNRPGYGSVIN